ncbi:MAG: hypothetical protein ICV62_17135 [Cyanobacteria bacterium Co-bin13]|nr:hypothetical protein [Cyanobacteria bacterium Co-bin13]
MTGTDVFQRANYLCRRQAYQQWHRLRSKQQILRSQVGFADPHPSRPKACEGCLNYHGLSYGTAKIRRTPLICAMHPYGWQEAASCPDWSQQ